MNEALSFEELAERTDVIGNDAGFRYHLLWSRAKVKAIRFNPEASTVELDFHWLVIGTERGWQRAVENDLPVTTLTFRVDPEHASPVLSHDRQRVTFWTQESSEVTLYTTPDNNIDEDSLKGITQGISLEITRSGAKIETFTPIAKIDVGYREYQHGPAAFNIVGYDYVGKEVLRMGISEPFAKRFVEQLLEVCNMERRDRPLIP